MTWVPEATFYHHPEAAYLMLGIPVIALLYGYLVYSRKEALRVFCGERLMPRLTRQRLSRITLFKSALLALAWMLGTLALMGPYTQAAATKAEQGVRSSSGSATSLRRKAHDVLLVIDTSASMSVKDARSGNTRLSFAKEIADEFVAQLEGESAALYSLNSVLVTEVPPTLDYLYLRLILRDIQLNEGGAAGTDFKRALSELRTKWMTQQEKAITLVIFSDGGDTEYEALQGAAKIQRLRDIVAAVSDGAQLQVLSVGVGSLEGGSIPAVTAGGKPVHSVLDETVLKALSAGHGEYFKANDYSAFQLARRLESLVEHHTRYQEVKTTGVRISGAQEGTPLYQLPLFGAILALLLALYLPERGAGVKKV